MKIPKTFIFASLMTLIVASPLVFAGASLSGSGKASGKFGSRVVIEGREATMKPPPSPAPPSIYSHDERHQLGGWIHISGQGFSPNNTVRFSIDGLVRRTGPLPIGFANTGAEGSFKDYIYDARCWNGQQEAATIHARDIGTGQEAIGNTYVYICH